MDAVETGKDLQSSDSTTRRFRLSSSLNNGEDAPTKTKTRRTGKRSRKKEQRAEGEHRDMFLQMGKSSRGWCSGAGLRAQPPPPVGDL